jgi:hypothetical protein
MRTRTKVRLGAGVVAILVIATVLDPHCYVRHYNLTVTDKEVKRMGNVDVFIIGGLLDNGKPRSFKNTDSKLYFKYNSSDINAMLRPNHRYRIKTVGWRLPFKSWYENILKVEPLPDLPDSTLVPHR